MMAQGFSEGAMVVGGALPEIPSPPPRQWGCTQGQAGAVLNPPLPGLTLSLELVKTLLNEPASVKVDEVSPWGSAGGWGGSSRVSMRGEVERPPQLSPHCWVSPIVGSRPSLAPFHQRCTWQT